MLIRVSIHGFTDCIGLIVVLSNLRAFLKFLGISFLCKGGVVSETVIADIRNKGPVIMKRVLILVLVRLFI